MFTFLSSPVFFLTLIMIGIVYVKSVNERSQASLSVSTKAVNEPQVLAATSTVSSPALSLSSDAQSAVIGQTITLNVTANTGGQAIVGYDVLLEGNPEQVEILQVASAQPEFEIFPGKIVSGSVYVTGSLKNALTSAKSINNQTLFTVTLRARKPGNLIINIQPQESTKRTKFITTDLNVITPAISSLSISIK